MGPLLYAAALLVLIPALYTYAASTIQMRLPRLVNKRICLLIAHPDDEAMFFAPTLLSLTRPETGNHVKILCLSSGDAEGLGETRKKELVKSALALGVRAESDIWVVDRPDDFPDSMTTPWDPTRIATLLSQAFSPPHLRASGAPTAAIDVLITFDARGVSAHPNHTSLYHGALAFLSELMRGKSGYAAPVDLYTLSSVAVWRKYLSVADIPMTMAAAVMRGLRGAEGKSKRARKEHPVSLVFVNQLVGEGALGAAWGAMVGAHKSQMAWFRWLWIVFSRYMVMNDLKLEKVR